MRTCEKRVSPRRTKLSRVSFSIDKGALSPGGHAPVIRWSPKLGFAIELPSHQGNASRQPQEAQYSRGVAWNVTSFDPQVTTDVKFWTQIRSDSPLLFWLGICVAPMEVSLYFLNHFLVREDLRRRVRRLLRILEKG